MEGLIILAIFFSAVLFGIPIAFSLIIASAIPLILFENMTLAAVAQNMFLSTDSYAIMAIPFFMLAGGLLEKGGVSRRLVAFARSLIGWLPGGLAIVSFLSCAFFGAISGSAVATCIAIGSIIVPTMKEDGYPLRFTLATVASGGYLGIIVPPSIPMVLYGIQAGASVSEMFLGGFIPGFMLAGGMSLYAIMYGFKHKGEIKSHKFSLRKVGTSFIDAIWALIMPGIILGGIYGGIFTPTEAAAVACLYGLLVGKFVYRELNFKLTVSIMKGAVVSTAMILFMLACASSFASVLNMKNLPDAMTTFVTGLCDSTFQFWLLITVLLFFIGMIMDCPPAVTILSPLLAPIGQSYGIDPVVFGVIMIINLGVGLVTPPVGMNLYTTARLANVQAKVILNRHLMWYIICSAAVMVLLMAAPGIIMFLPELFRK